MKYVTALAFFGALLPNPAGAICVISPLEPDLREADVVYVGTVVRSELVPSLESLRGAKRPRERRAEIRHTLEPEIVFKGQPAKAPAVFSIWQYNNPRSKQVVAFAERLPLMPGDTILVVGRAGQSVQIGLCTASRDWTSETAKQVFAAFPPAPNNSFKPNPLR